MSPPLGGVCDLKCIEKTVFGPMKIVSGTRNKLLVDAVFERVLNLFSSIDPD